VQFSSLAKLGQLAKLAKLAKLVNAFFLIGLRKNPAEIPTSSLVLASMRHRAFALITH
jgi:hypothetical protein